MSSLAMDRAQREAFLADTHVAVITVAQPGRGPLAVPVWYGYEPGGSIRFVTGERSRKAALMRSAGRIGLCVQTESPPYRYVSVEGPVTFGAPDRERDVRQLAIRYLGEAMGAQYAATLEADPEPMVLVTMRPARWFSADYSKMG